jgi:hypothetical protein
MNYSPFMSILWAAGTFVVLVWMFNSLGTLGLTRMFPEGFRPRILVSAWASIAMFVVLVLHHPFRG